MKLINENDYSSRFPKENDKYFSSLDASKKEEYLSLVSLYTDLLYKYILKNTDIKKYDDLFSASLKTVPEEDMDLYQSLATEYFNYFYIRNNIHVENLSSEEISFLNNCNDNYDEKTEEFIKNTYKKVIFEAINGKTNVVNINYGPNTPMFYAPNDSLIIGIRYDNKVEDFRDPKSFQKANEDLEFANDELNKLYQELKSSLEKFNIIRYDDASIKKKEIANEISRGL